MIQSVIILGSGSAGLLAALSLKRKIPQLSVRVVRSPDIGIIGVGEGTTPIFPKHLFEYLKIRPRLFYDLARPTWKLGVRLAWGPRPYFDYGVGRELDAQWNDLPRPHGFYCDEDFKCVDIFTALMEHGKAAARLPNGQDPDFQSEFAYHIENKKLVDTLESIGRGSGIEFIDGNLREVVRGPRGVEALELDDGRRLEADFFIDASGFRSELVGRALQEPFVAFDRSLFCDRAAVGGWERTDEPIQPFTLAETMDAGWCWRIEHEHFINRGYVYNSSYISDEHALAEIRLKNPKMPDNLRIVKFTSGRYRRAWIDNVVAIGNSCGFVEPLEATALMVVCWQCQTLITSLLHSELMPLDSMRDMYNGLTETTWDEIRDFLAIHYKFNTRLETPFWKHCQKDTDVSGVARLLEFYNQNGPTGLCRHLLNKSGGNLFGLEGFLVVLVGMRVPYRTRRATEGEQQIWNRHRAQFIAQARAGFTTEEALAHIRHPGWRWADE